VTYAKKTPIIIFNFIAAAAEAAAMIAAAEQDLLIQLQ
jgi:hypothetical protein